MSYQLALQAAGASVIDTKYTGSYQGSWGSIVEYNGKRGLVIGAYGSCSYCDAFQAEFDRYNDDDEVGYDEESGKYYKGWGFYGDNEITREEYDSAQADYQRRLADFGSNYLHTILDKWDIENRLKGFKEDEWFDGEEKELFEWALSQLSEH